jgi:hypothetical protein
MIALVPTVPDPAEFRRTPVGTWTIKVDMSATPLAGAQAMDVWVQRDDDPTQLGTGGQQSRLVDLAGNAAANPLPPIRGYGCINGIGTAPSTIRVAGYDQTTREPSPYSGSSALAALPGGDVIMGPEAPVISAVADQGAFRPGLPSIGVLSGSGARIVGTSAATSRPRPRCHAGSCEKQSTFRDLPCTTCLWIQTAATGCEWRWRGGVNYRE